MKFVSIWFGWCKKRIKIGLKILLMAKKERIHEYL